MINQFEKTLIQLAIDEDAGNGDHTSLACIPATSKGKAQLLIKDQGILAGIEVAKEVFKMIDAELSIKTFLEDGDTITLRGTCRRSNAIPIGFGEATGRILPARR